MRCIVLLVLLLLTVSRAFASEDYLTSKAINKKLLEVVEQLRQVIPRGYPALGVPALDPWRVARIAQTLQETSLKLYFEATGVNISNSRNFEVVSLESSVRPLQAKINIKIPLLKITADQYKLQGTAMFLFPVKGNGKLEVSLYDVSVLSTVTLDTSTPSIEDLVVHISVNRVQAKLSGTSPLVNSLLSQYGAGIINGKREQISAAARDQLVPPLNEYLANIPTEELLRLIITV